jgi:uncharacterized UBP type Zn finger protein
VNNKVADSCEHMDKVNQDLKGNTKGCEECEKIGSDWVHLRLCLTCGHVGCCDSSVNKHGTKHFKSTGHPIIRSFEPGENWKCVMLMNFLSDSKLVTQGNQLWTFRR